MVNVLNRKRGILLTAMPGARNRRMVTMKLAAPPVVDMVKKISASA